MSSGAAEAEYKDFYRPVSETLGYILIMNCQINSKLKKNKPVLPEEKKHKHH